MKTKCSFILKSSIALILTVLMLLGSISSVIAATVDMADLGANADLASTGDSNYYVAGAFNGWNATGNLMYQTDSNTYAVIVNVGGSNSEYKVTDGTWDNAWPSSNESINSGIQKITFNSSTHAVSDASFSGYTIAGTANLCTSDWAPGDPRNELSGGSITYEDVPAGDYEFKVTNGTWDTSYGYSSSKVTFSGNASNNSSEDGKNIKFKTTATSNITISFNSSNQNITVNAVVPETLYSVGVTAGSNGTVASSSVQAGATTPVTLPTANPNYGYKFKNWTASGGGVSITNPTSASGATIKATGTGGTVTANFERDTNMNLYIAGRFQIWDGSNDIESYTSGGWSNTGENKIKFTWDATANMYKVNTGKSPKDLSAQLNSNDRYFFVYDADYSKHYFYSSSQDYFTDSNTSVTLTAYENTDSAKDVNIKFDSTSEDYPVTLWYDPTTGELSYSIPTFYNITVATATGGSVTASPTRCEEGTSVTLTIEPETGYELTGLTTSPSVTLSGTGNTRTFAMPAADVTVTPEFSKITWSDLTAVAKYSTTGAENSYTNALTTSPAVSIAATSATQLDGVTVSAPLNTTVDGVTYHFVGWTATNGSFENDTLVVTKFKPTAASSQAIAKYKKIFTITSSVDNTGTGAGAAPVISVTSGGVDGQPNQVMAGGSYTITATPATGSAVESVTVNGTAKTATESQTISSVSDDQSVVVKFKSMISLGNKGFTDKNDKWETPEMSYKSENEYSIKFTAQSARDYNFKVVDGTKSGDAQYINSYTDDAFDNGGTTSTIELNSSDSNNIKLTLSESADVTIVYNVSTSKITSILIDPTDSTTYAITVGEPEDAVLTATYRGTTYSEGNTINARAGQQITFSATTADNKYITGYTLGGTAVTSPYTVTASDAGKTLTCAVASKLSVKAVTNKSARGTVSIDKNTAAPGETITITVTPLAGTLKSLTANYGNGKVYEWKSGNNWQESTAGQSASAPASALMNMFANPFKFTELAATGAALDEATVAAMPDLVPVGAASTIEMTLAEPSAVTINATFDSYSGESNYYYTGYDSSSGSYRSRPIVDDYDHLRLSEGLANGEPYGYIQIDRSGDNQLFKISRSVNDGYVYLTINSNNNGTNTWDNNSDPQVYFIGSDSSWDDKHTMEWVDNNGSEKRFRYQVPSNATGAVFYDPGSKSQTIDVAWVDNEYLTTGYYTSGGVDDNGTKKHGIGTYSLTSTIETPYNYNDNSVYTNATDFGSQVNYSDYDQWYANPNKNTGGYYVVVYYPNTDYGTIGNNNTNYPKVVVTDTLPGVVDEAVNIFAKDGSIRSESYGSTYANIADTKIYAANGTSTVGTKHNGSIANQTYETYKAAKGDTLVIKTQIGATDTGTLDNAADLKAKYYVRGFCINGEVSELLSWNADGLYTVTFKVPEDTEITKFEITPIYYLKDTTANKIVTYRVTGFTDELKAVGTGKPGWGDTLYTYPFYGKLGGQNNAFGAYPGQPMVYYKGQYQMQIPVKSTAWDPYGETAATVNATNVAGVTMSNGYWDSVHKSIMGYGDNSSSADHVQTYDYGDFYKIFNEKAPVDNIVFDFKYRTAKHNLTDIITTNTTASDLTSKYGTNGNGFELLTNFHGKNVDLFGTPLSGAAADPTQTTPVYVVSTGGVIDNTSGVENIAGYYATEWVVYGNTSGDTYQRISADNKYSIPPEVLILNDDDDTSFSTATYPSAVDTTTKPYKITDWEALYTALETYRGKPVYISYEAADAQQGQEMYYTGTGGATRNDGRWLYSKNGENITSNIRIDVSHDSGATYVENPASGETGHIDGLSAYFTNADAYQKMTYSTTIDPDKTFDFEAKTTNASYKFVGWYMEDGTKITSDNVSHTERSGSYTFVARFMEVSSGQLTLSHSVDTGAEVEVAGHYYTCDGSGTAKIGAVVTDAETNEVLRTFDLSSSDITIPEKYIGNDKNYNITVTLEATADTNTAYGTSKLANTDASSVTEARFFNPKTPTSSGKTTTYTFTFNVKDDLYNGTNQRALALTYHSYFIQYKFNYQINYTFDDRNGKTKQYKRIGTLTPGEANTYVKKVDSNRYLDKSFIEKMAPYESNFGQDITWNFEDYLISTGGEDGSNYEYSIEAHYTATQTNLNKRNITFVLPYQHNNGVAVMTDGVGTKATTNNLELIAVTDQDGKITQDNRVNFNAIPVLPNNGENGIFTEEGKKNWIAAPATIVDGSSTYNFQYWSVKPTDRAGENDPDVARCYFQGFNFVAYDNYIITPVYGASTVTPSDIGRNTNITYVETTRNQWNSNGTDYAKTQTSYAADLLYNDFIIAYNYDGKDIYNGEANDDIAELGVVVERIKKLEIKDDGSYDTTISRYSNIAPNEEGVNAAIASATDIKLSGSNSISKHAITPSSLDNKNRIQFYNGIYNSAGWVQNSEGGTPVQNYAYKNYVYRAYSYMKLKDGTVIKSAVPAYFTMYDVATADAIDM